MTAASTPSRGVREPAGCSASQRPSSDAPYDANLDVREPEAFFARSQRGAPRSHAYKWRCIGASQIRSRMNVNGHGNTGHARGCHRNTGQNDWVAVKELNLSYNIPETLLFTIGPYSCNK